MSELEALLALLSGLATGDEEARPAIEDLPLPLLREHLLAPQVYELGYRQLERDFVNAALLAERRAGLLAEAVSALAASEIPSAPIKGMAYVDRLYPDPALRPMTDIDLLVPPHRFREAVARLAAIGYRDVSSPVAAASVHHARTLRRAESMIDLHRTIVQPLRSRIDLDAVWERASPPSKPAGAWQLELVDLAMFHLAHIARHELGVAAVSYADAWRMCELLGDAGLRELEQRARAARLRVGIDAALVMTRALAAGRARIHWRGRLRLLPQPLEVLAYRLPWRPLQIARKAALLEGPAELGGLAAVHVMQQLAGLRQRMIGARPQR